MSELAEGHLFTISTTIQGVSSVGVEGFTQCDEVGGALTIKVRAWSLPAALQAASERPLHEWEGWPEEILADEPGGQG